MAGEDWGDENKNPDLNAVFQGLDAADVTTTFDSVTSILAVEIAVGKAGMITRRPLDSALLVNGVAAIDTGVTPNVTATSSTVKKVVVTTGTPGGDTDENLIVDFLGGTYATGTTGGIGFDIDLGGATPGSDDDIVNIRGTSGKDAWYVGVAGELSLGNDDITDLKFTGVETLNLAMASGDDTFSATNATAIKGVTGNATVAVVVYGGGGKDVLVGGDGADRLFGGLDDDTITGGLGIDTIYGEQGVDTILTGTAVDGADVISCGTAAVGATKAELDVVTYAARSAGVKIALALAAAADFDGSVGADNEDTFTAADCETLIGTAYADVLFGNALDNVISGGAGDDVIAGNDGADTLNGDTGNDRFDETLAASTGKGADIINGGVGVDFVDYSLRTAVLTVTMDGKAADDGEVLEKDNVKSDVENIKGGSAADKLTGNEKDNIFFEGVGGVGVLTGGDIYSGLLGNDTVDYSGRTVAVTATMGNETADDGIAGENDNIKNDIENLSTGTGDDNVTGNDLDNTLDMGTATGFNRISCGGGDDLVLGTLLRQLANPDNCEITEGPVAAL